MESVNYVKPQEGTVFLRSIFGEETSVPARVHEMDLTGHRIVLEAT
jgi:predicted RNA-binding protein